MQTCPPDILAKMEQETLADKILKYGSAGVFFGSLGIGTGRGTGGATGYVPLGGGGGGGGVRLGNPVTTLRPTLPLGSVVPVEVIPVDAVDPLGPAILPPEFPSIVEDPLVIQPPRFPSVVDEDGLIVQGGTSAGRPAEIPFTTPKITTDHQPAILEVQPETRDPKIITRTQYENPTFEVSVTSSSGAGESSATDHIHVHGFSGGVQIGESIPLQELSFSRSFSTTIEEETAFLTSTPGETQYARPQFYGRRFQQVPVRDPAFVTNPRNLVTFDNPAFDESIDLLFEQDIADLARAAPAEEFRDVVKLSKPYYHRAPEGHIRVSRVGTKATMKTRSGLIIGPQSHYYFDVSDIAPAEDIELTVFGNFPLGEQSGEAVISSGSSDMEVITLSDSILEPYPDEFLLDDFDSVGNDLQLVIGGRRSQTVSVPNVLRQNPQVFPSFEGVHVIHADDSATSDIPIEPKEIPALIIDYLGEDFDFYLHPAFLKKRRRKCNLYNFVADGGVASC